MAADIDGDGGGVRYRASLVAQRMVQAVHQRMNVGRLAVAGDHQRSAAVPFEIAQQRIDPCIGHGRAELSG